VAVWCTRSVEGFRPGAREETAVTLMIHRVACSDSVSGQGFPASAVLTVGDSTCRGRGRFLVE
jgi:uncharacterized membrane protein